MVLIADDLCFSNKCKRSSQPHTSSTKYPALLKRGSKSTRWQSSRTRPLRVRELCKYAVTMWTLAWNSAVSGFQCGPICRILGPFRGTLSFSDAHVAQYSDPLSQDYQGTVRGKADTFQHVSTFCISILYFTSGTHSFFPKNLYFFYFFLFQNFFPRPQQQLTLQIPGLFRKFYITLCDRLKADRHQKKKTYL